MIKPFAASFAWYLIHILTAKRKTSQMLAGTRQHCFGCGSCSLTRNKMTEIAAEKKKKLSHCAYGRNAWFLVYFSFCRFQFLLVLTWVFAVVQSLVPNVHIFGIGCIHVQHLRSAGSWGFVTFHSTVHVTVPRVPPRLQTLVRVRHFNQSARG